MTTTQLASGDFESFLKSEKIVIIRLHNKEPLSQGPERLDKRVKNYFVAEYQPDIALGSLDISDIFPLDLWSKKHLASFATKGEGYYLAYNGQLIAWHSEVAVEPISAQAIAKVINEGSKGKAALLFIASTLHGAAASHLKPNLPENIAKSIIEHFESMLSTAKN